MVQQTHNLGLEEACELDGNHICEGHAGEIWRPVMGLSCFTRGERVQFRKICGGSESACVS